MNSLIDGRSDKMIPSLSGLRAIAIFLVIASHILVGITTPSWLKTLLYPIATGKTGVRLFFVISGFLITWLMLVEKRERGRVNLVRFYIRRFLRIFPVFYFYVFFVFIMGKISGYQLAPGVYITALTYTRNFDFWGSNWLLAHSWSLAVEEQFYLLWPPIVRKIKWYSGYVAIPVLLLGVLCRIIAYRYPDLSRYFLAPFLQYADFLYGGAYLAYMRMHEPVRLKKILEKISGILVALGAIMVFALARLEYHAQFDRIFLPVTGTLLILYFTILIGWTTQPENQSTWGVRVLNFRWMSFAGVLSYSLYVWQQFFLVPGRNLVSGRWWTHFPQNLFLLMASATLSYFIIEKPILKLKNRFH